ncbi:alpha/beta hydrolase [Ponticoccus sp. SC2-23]|nr:alpha/beta hydrolase [Alexandriicola marinus]MBM1218800.1 alpha/beta hydrolase [Ponticoccus sp. SC6-9]MBM1224128.1 alpha/beta hydrolase [Ponticoccus sp. SC6-15]MBM1230093.1 alpha/beta hydrolase [Ponticoccus sp. SC6-38]MBM1233094.1 alpha/beta hydrolase [Ponticoccus sp. SC6-45]MBM1236956.1 alpha/beta hydrolase [Ponticoccus sp. SC6-49]MBM1242105.1 alpha/beta hydrolase [Ponticoccus sp. SC2-64]MBM1246618.1 alpha/beta hydrolase [Ponticoccus sp. SC6-42]MBM1251096.1 alpha/beta hydrolase [Pontico
MPLALRVFLIVLAGLIGTLILITAWRAQARSSIFEARFPAEGQFVEVDGTRVHAVVMGSGPDLVLIHGAGGSTRDFTQGIAQRLAQSYRVIVFDRPGLGHTEQIAPAHGRAFSTSAATIVEQATLLRGAALALGAERPVVAGHSFGASVALAWAVTFPDDIAALVDVAGPSLPWPGELSSYYRINGSFLGGIIVPPLIAAWAPESRIETAVEAVFTPDPVPEGYAANAGAELVVRPRSLRSNARQVNSLRPQIVELTPAYGDLDLPVEILHGDADVTVPLTIHSGPLSDLIPGANLTVLPGVGHMPHHADTDALVAAIDRAAMRAGLR